MIRYGGNTALRDANTASIIYTVYIACTVLQPWRKMYGGLEGLQKVVVTPSG